MLFIEIHRGADASWRRFIFVIHYHQSYRSIGRFDDRILIMSAGNGFLKPMLRGYGLGARTMLEVNDYRYLEINQTAFITFLYYHHALKLPYHYNCLFMLP